MNDLQITQPVRHRNMIAKTVAVLVVVCFVVLRLYSYFAPDQLLKKENPYLSYPQALVTIQDASYTVALARTAEEKELGLSRVPRMDVDRGMMFIFKDSGIYPFWMKEMNFDLDFIWVRNGRVVEVTPYVSAAPVTQLNLIRPAVEVDAVIELNAGEIEKNKIGVGNTVSIEYLDSREGS